jgi:uncharacterized RDD family membrane protein YckC
MMDRFEETPVPPPSEVQPSPSDPPHLPDNPAPSPAPVLRRLAAVGIDLIVINLCDLLLIAAALAGLSIGLRQVRQPLPSQELIASLTQQLTFGWSLLFIGYFSYFTAQGGQTPGQRLLRITVVRLDGTDIGWPRAAWRSVVLFISLPFFFIAWLVVALPGKRAPHDYAAGTRVVRVR